MIDWMDLVRLIEVFSLYYGNCFYIYEWILGNFNKYFIYLLRNIFLVKISWSEGY